MQVAHRRQEGEQSRLVVFRRGRILTPRQKALGEHIANVTAKMNGDFDPTTSQTQANLVYTGVIAESGQSIAQVAFHKLLRGRRK